MRLSLAFLVSVMMAAHIHAELVTYPAGPGVVTKTDDFSVSVSQGGGLWRELDVYPVLLDETREGRHNVEEASMAAFDMEGKTDVMVISRRGSVESAKIRPLSYSIENIVKGDTLFFSVDNPCNLSVEVNGDIFHNLHLFANPLDKNRPSDKEIKKAKKGGKLIYFGPGLHKLPGDTLCIESGSTVYVDGGAYVEGCLIADSVHDVRFFGRGEIRPKGRGYGIFMKHSHDLEAEGVIVSQIPVGECDGVRISNVKSLTSYGWGDGMNVFASSNVDYDGVFCRNSDDCSTVYATRLGFTGGCRNITMKNSTLWADVAHPIMIGIHGNVECPDTIENIVYRNIDILDHKEMQLDYQGCFSISCGDENLVRNVTFDDIRVEDFRQGQLLNLRIFYNRKYCLAPGRGIHDVLFKDINYTGHNSEISIIAGYDDERMVKNVTFDNLVINGVRYSDDMEGKLKWHKTGDLARIFIGEHTENIIFK